MRVPPAFRQGPTLHPMMDETRPGSIFTPAIAAWSSPGQLGALGLPNWMSYVLAGGLLFLAYKRTIPWWAGLAGAGAAWWFLGGMGNMAVSVANGIGIVSNGTTLQLSVNSPGTLVTLPNGVATLTVAGIAYPVLQTAQNQDGTTTYYLDNPNPTV